MKCSECKYWANQSTIRGAIVAQCRRFPPRVGARPIAEFPVTRVDDFCGEFASLKVVKKATKKVTKKSTKKPVAAVAKKAA